MQQTETKQNLSEQLKADCVVNERAQEPIIKAEGLAYAVFQRKNLDKATSFFEDFGLVVTDRSADRIYFRGREGKSVTLVLQHGDDNRLAALGLRTSMNDLNKVSQVYSTSIQNNARELGGEYVSISDPNGVAIELCNGLRQFEQIGRKPDQPHNESAHKARIGEPVRCQIEAPTVNRLGHSVMAVAEIKTSIEWYQNNLGMIVSDFQFIEGDNLPAIAFMRFDLGPTPTDHHSIALASIIETGHVHSAFEMEDFEEVAIAGEWVRRQGYTHAWGMGRHILGSQIFDYWREPDGDLFEHYADGDVFDSDAPTGYHLLTANAQHQWGPETPKEFTGENRYWPIIKSLFRRLSSNDDLSFGRLRRIIKALNS